MNDQTTTPSGSRWEPDGDPTPTSPDVPATAEERRAQVRGRAILAGAATALTLGGGLAGFVIGNATAGDGSSDLQPANFHRDGSDQGPGGQLGEGQQGPPSFRDGNGAGHGDGSGPPPASDDGSSSDGSGATGSST